jgi:NTP pyrophosphatase (non-canonical NTP hydrolase)
MKKIFVESFTTVMEVVNNIARGKGWWKGDRNEAELLMLMTCELAEACEWLRAGNPQSDHIPEFSGVEEELADCVIRIMDYAHAKKYRLPEAILAKIEFNATRPHMHGGKKF